MRISDWSSDVCSSDLLRHGTLNEAAQLRLPLILQHGHAFLRTFLCHRTTTDQLKLGRFQRHPMKRVVLHDLHGNGVRSEEHTSELQSLMRISHAVFCLKNKTLIFTLLYTFLMF